MAKTKAFSFKLEKRFLVGAAVLLASIALLYTYFVMLSVAHALEREEFVFESGTLSQEVAQLESSYLSALRTVTEGEARTLGLISVNERTFVERGTLTFGAR